MSYRLVFHRLAERDINDIGDFIANDKPAAASRWVGRIIAHWRKLAQMPQRGAPRPDIGDRIRILPFEKSATVVYRVDDEVVTVLRILYASRDYPDEWPN